MADCFFFPDDPACAPEPTPTPTPEPTTPTDGGDVDGGKDMDMDMNMNNGDLSPWSGQIAYTLVAALSATGAALDLFKYKSDANYYDGYV